MGHPMFNAWLIGCLIAVRLVQIGKGAAGKAAHGTAAKLAGTSSTAIA
jgi:hypothetical protein